VIFSYLNKSIFLEENEILSSFNRKRYSHYTTGQIIMMQPTFL
jgi:hypothetical protein